MMTLRLIITWLFFGVIGIIIFLSLMYLRYSLFQGTWYLPKTFLDELIRMNSEKLRYNCLIIFFLGPIGMIYGIYLAMISYFDDPDDNNDEEDF